MPEPTRPSHPAAFRPRNAKNPLPVAGGSFIKPKLGSRDLNPDQRNQNPFRTVRNRLFYRVKATPMVLLTGVPPKRLTDRSLRPWSTCPPYSPDLNPIELAFAKLKALLRQAGARSIDELEQVIAKLLDKFSTRECLAYFRHCGYSARQRGNCSKARPARRVAVDYVSQWSRALSPVT